MKVADAPEGSPVALSVTPLVEPVRVIVSVVLPIEPPAGAVMVEAASESEMLPLLFAVLPPPPPQCAASKASRRTGTRRKLVSAGR